MEIIFCRVLYQRHQSQLSLTQIFKDFFGIFDKLTDPSLIFWVVITGEVLVVVVTEVGEVRAATVMLVGDVLVT